MVFSFVFHQVLKALAIDLDTDDLRPKVPTAYFTNRELQQGEDVRLPIPAFFDDFVLVVIAATPEELISKCARVLEKKQSGKAFASRGMEVNDSVRKTEVLLPFNGTGAAKVGEVLNSGTPDN